MINAPIKVYFFLVCLSMFSLMSCVSPKKVDILVYNGTIYTVDSNFTKQEAMVASNGKIVATGRLKLLEKKYKAREKIDVEGKFVFPGFIDAHAHFLQYGIGLQTVNLVGTNGWEEILIRLQNYASTHPNGWLIGRGWDQNDWPVKEFPDRQKLDSLFPSRPVLLTRIDGHAAIANQMALELSKLQPTQKITGGTIEVRNGRMTGVLIDNAVRQVSNKVPSLNSGQMQQALQDAQSNCFAVGLTTIDDCGLNHETVDLIHKMQETGDLKMRLYVMLSDLPRNYEYLFRRGIIKTPRLHVRSFKVYADGALGSRGACLLQPYEDAPGNYGFLLSDATHFSNIADSIYKRGFQLCTHAIGDSANRLILDTYAKVLNKTDDRRWRIEHAQVIAPSDFSKFGASGIVPSVQPTHATSDMYWAHERLGEVRVKGAYAFKQLLQQNGWIPLGTDFPVEDIDPLKTFYAAVVRKDSKGWPEKGFQSENALTRVEALRGMTIWAAYANFEEHEKGSLEKGKYADFIILDKDLLSIPEEEIPSAKVLKTFLNAEKVFDHKKK